MASVVWRVSRAHSWPILNDSTTVLLCVNPAITPLLKLKNLWIQQSDYFRKLSSYLSPAPETETILSIWIGGGRDWNSSWPKLFLKFHVIKLTTFPIIITYKPLPIPYWRASPQTKRYSEEVVSSPSLSIPVHYPLNSQLTDLQRLDTVSPIPGTHSHLVTWLSLRRLAQWQTPFSLCQCRLVRARLKRYFERGNKHVKPINEKCQNKMTQLKRYLASHVSLQSPTLSSSRAPEDLNREVWSQKFPERLHSFWSEFEMLSVSFTVTIKTYQCRSQSAQQRLTSHYSILDISTNIHCQIGASWFICYHFDTSYVLETSRWRNWEKSGKSSYHFLTVLSEELTIRIVTDSGDEDGVATKSGKNKPTIC